MVLLRAAKQAVTNKTSKRGLKSGPVLVEGYAAAPLVNPP